MKFFRLRKLRRILIKKWLLNLNKRPIIKRLSLIAILIIIISLSILYYGLLFFKLNNDLKLYNKLPSNNYKCHSFKSDLLELDYFINRNGLNVNKKIKKLNIQISTSKIDSKILLLFETQFSKLGRSLIEFLQNAKFKFDIELTKNIPPLASQNKGKYSLIIFENYNNYLQLNKWNLNLINQYCLEYGVALIGFLINKDDKLKRIHQLKRSSLFIKSNLQIKDYHINDKSEILRLTKSGSVCNNLPIKKGWTVFYFNQTNYRPIGLAYNSNNLVTTVVQDLGNVDGIKRILFGNNLFWLHKLLLLDSISYLTNNKISLPIERYLQIDIDDIFVGEKGTRLKVNDVESLIDAQNKLSKIVDGFKFNLGFSGKHLHRGDDEEDLGDDHLLKYSHKFRWFCHMWAHSQSHLFDNQTILENQMELNKKFAQKYNIKIDTNYSVSPHHSGVYPVHESLYNAWKNVYNLKMTSTEEYPHLRPARLRKGFIYKNIMVLPRQTCGLYTHTIYINKYPGGKQKLDENIFGGELFLTFIFNPIMIFMTHMSNYGNDHIAYYTFESLFNFLKCWTTLKFKSIEPIELGKKYFDIYSEEKMPIWTNPCNDKRHLSIWSKNKTCNNLPEFLIIGPQKTGTTALYSFLNLHPLIKSNYPTKEYFEELQFFNGPNYLKGLDWYISKFPALENTNNSTNKSVKIFEKSANYFDGDKVPERVHTLLPNVKLIVILINPIKRSYSWYQHARSHNDIAAKNNSFYDVITTKTSQFRQLKTLRNRILNPGCYSNYLDRWLQYFNKEQLIIIDGDKLKSNPIKVMSDLQLKLNLDEIIDYNNHLRYVPKKGFYCQIFNLTINSNHLKNINSNYSKSLDNNEIKNNIKSDQKNQLNIHRKINFMDVLNGSYFGTISKLNQTSNQDNQDIDNIQTKCLGKSKGRVYEEMDNRSADFLHKYYMKCNSLLFKLLVKLEIPVPEWLID